MAEAPNRWARIKHLFELALEQPPGRREEFARNACGADPVECSELLMLLRQYALDGRVPEDPTLTASGPGPPVVPFGDASDRRIGAVLKSRYRVHRRLGTGGLGVVYLAEDLNLLNRRVVVKFLHEFGEPDPARLRKFKQEIEALARIDHPGVVTAFDAGETEDSTPFLVMQYVDGQTVRHLIEQGPVALERAASVLRQLGEALQAAHDKRIIHRDLKPENIMLQQLGDRDVVKLIDFGIARVEASRIGSDTAVLTVAGTPSYMAPEQLSGRPEMASDIFALGVIAYEMLVGKRPFPSRHPYQLRQQHRTGIPRGTMRRMRPEISAAAETAVRRALTFNPSDRPAKAKEWCDSLATALLHPDRVSSRRILIAAALAGLLAILAGAVWWYWRRGIGTIREPVIAEHKGGLDPLDEGFRAKNITGTPVWNLEHTGFDRWSMQAREQGSYSFPLTEAEVRESLRRGWKVTFSGYPEVGGMNAAADFHGSGPRFDLSMFRETDGKVWVMWDSDGLRHELTKAAHKCEMIYDPVTSACSLYVDGARIFTNYRGHTQQQSQPGFFFGASVWKSDRAESAVDLARFELL